MMWLILLSINFFQLFNVSSVGFLRGIRDHFDTKFKIEPCRNQDMDINHKRALEEKEREAAEKKQKKKRNLQLPQEIENDKEANQEPLDDEEEERKRKQKLEDEEKEKSIKEYLKLGHEKILLSCLGIGYTNISKTFI